MDWPFLLPVQKREEQSVTSRKKDTDDRDPNFVTNGGRKAIERLSRIVDRLEYCKATLLKDAVTDNDREDACSTGLGSTEQPWQFKRGDERGGQEISTDEKNGKAGHCQCGGDFAFPE